LAAGQEISINKITTQEKSIRTLLGGVQAKLLWVTSFLPSLESLMIESQEQPAANFKAAEFSDQQLFRFPASSS